MIIIRFFGGLGNQLFQYGLYKKFKALGRDVYADCEYIQNAKRYYSTPSRSGMAANVANGIKNLGISLEMVQNRNDIYRYTGSRKHLSGLISRYITGNTHLVSEIEQYGYNGYHPQIFSMEKGYFDGYWQSEDYFKDIREDIRKEISFTPLRNKENIEILKIIHDSISVSVHIRRGDYLDPDVSRSVGNICTDEYYRKAIEYFTKINRDSYFFFFSNDSEWVRENYGSDVKNAYFIDWNKGENDYYDMYLMSECKHNIIANSSFSWWGAWLNNNPEKIVISPTKWDNYGTMPDTICKDWIKIDQLML